MKLPKCCDFLVSEDSLAGTAEGFAPPGKFKYFRQSFCNAATCGLGESMMRKSGWTATLVVGFTALVAAFATIPGCGGGSSGPVIVAQPDDGQYGSVLNFQEFDAAPHALPAEALLQPPLPPVLPVKVA